jgi:ParB family chromosome partitioning protein
MADVAPAATAEVTSGSTDSMPIERLVANPDQPRRTFAPEAMEELARSVREKGIIQPIIVRPSSRAPDQFEIVAGERRWRAAQMAQLHEVPVVVRSFSDREVAEIAIIENIQRADLNPIEEATGFSVLMERYGHTQDRLAEALGKSRSHIANMLRLLALPEDVRAMLSTGQLSAGHARALIPLGAGASAAARDVVAKGLSVRATEALARKAQAGGQDEGKKRHTPSEDKDSDTRALEADLAAHLGIGVSIDHRGPGGTLTLRYGDLAQLDDICRRLAVTD